MTNQGGGKAGRTKPTRAAVAASGVWTDESGVRQPAGEVHAWRPGHNQTVCGLPLHRGGLQRFPHVPFDYRASDVLTGSDQVGRICPRCIAATSSRPRRSRVFRRP